MTRIDYRTGKQPLAAKFLIGLVFFLLILLLIGLGRQFYRKRALDEEIAALQQELAKQQAARDEYNALLNFYDSEFFAEHEARTKFNMQKSGEQAVVISLDNAGEVSAALKQKFAAADATRAAESAPVNYRVWWDYFFGE